MAIIKRELVVNFERNVKKDFDEFLKLGESLAPKLKKFNEYLEEIQKFNEKYKEEINYAEIADKTSVSVELGDFEDLKGEKSKSTQKIQSRVTKYRKDFDKIQNLNSDYFDKIFKGKSKAESLKSKIEQLKNHIDGMSLSKLKDNDNIYKEWKDMGEKFYEALSQFVSQKFVKSAETIKLNIGNIKRIYRETANPTIQTMVVPEFEKAEQNAKSAMEIYKTLTKEMGRIRNNFINFAKADELENDLSTLTESMMAATSRISSIVDFLKQYSTDGGSWKTYFSNISGGGGNMVGGESKYIEMLKKFANPGPSDPSFYVKYKDTHEKFTEKQGKLRGLEFEDYEAPGANKNIHDQITELNTKITELKVELNDLESAKVKNLAHITAKKAEIKDKQDILSQREEEVNTKQTEINELYLKKYNIIKEIYTYLKDEFSIDYTAYNTDIKRYTGFFKKKIGKTSEYEHSKNTKKTIDLNKIPGGYDNKKSYLIPLLSDAGAVTNYYILVPIATYIFQDYDNKTTDMDNLYIVYSSTPNNKNKIDFINPNTGLPIIYYQVFGNKDKTDGGGKCDNLTDIYISQMCYLETFKITDPTIDTDINMWDYFFNEEDIKKNSATNSMSDCSSAHGLVKYFYSTNEESVTTRHQFIHNIIEQRVHPNSNLPYFKAARTTLKNFEREYKTFTDANLKFSKDTQIVDIDISKTEIYEQNNDGSSGTSAGLGLGATGTTTTTYNEPNPEGERLTAQLTREVFGEIQTYEKVILEEIGKFLKYTKISSTSKGQTPEALLNDISSYIKKLMLIEHEFKVFKEAKTFDQTMIGWDLQETMTNKNIDTDRSGIMELKSKLDTQYKDVLEADLNVYKDSNPLLYMRKFLQKQEPGSSALLDPAYFAKFLNEKSNLIKLTTGLINPKEAYDIECGITKVYEAFVKREKDTSNPNPITFGNDATYQYSMIQKAEECKKKKQNDKNKKEKEKDRKAGYKAPEAGDGYEDGDGDGDENKGRIKSKKSKGGSRRTLKLSSKRRKTIKKRKPKDHIIKKHQKH